MPDPSGHYAPPMAAPPLLCVGCGYDLRGVCSPTGPLGGCPECGEPFAYDEVRARANWRGYPAESVIGWLLLTVLVYPWVMLGVVVGALIVAYGNADAPVAIAVVGAGLFAFAWLVNLPLSRRLQNNVMRRQSVPEKPRSVWARRLIPPAVAVLQCLLAVAYFGGCLACVS